MTAPVPEVLAEVRRLDQAATGGPWTTTERAGASVERQDAVVAPRVFLDADAELIAYYRTAAPALAEALQRVLDLAQTWEDAGVECVYESAVELAEMVRTAVLGVDSTARAASAGSDQ